MWYKSYTGLRVHFDAAKSRELRKNRRRGIGFEEATEIFQHEYFLSPVNESPQQFRATGWVKGSLYSLIFEVREDKEGEYFHFVTLWRATGQERRSYEENS